MALLRFGLSDIPLSRRQARRLLSLDTRLGACRQSSGGASKAVVSRVAARLQASWPKHEVTKELQPRMDVQAESTIRRPQRLVPREIRADRGKW